jgi:hypothetical protein
LSKEFSFFFLAEIFFESRCGKKNWQIDSSFGAKNYFARFLTWLVHSSSMMIDTVPWSHGFGINSNIVLDIDNGTAHFRKCKKG